MTSPFDIVKSLTQTKDDLFASGMVESDYVPYMVNRILSNSPRHALFAQAMNSCHGLDKKMQYDFYRNGIPKSNTRTNWIKKEVGDYNEEHIDYICSSMNVSVKRATELYRLMSPDDVHSIMDSRGTVY